MSEKARKAAMARWNKEGREKMKVKEFMLKRSTLEEFAENEALDMEIHERSHKPGPRRFYAFFSNVEVSEGSVLVSTFGNGSTPDEAITAYIDEISGKPLVVNARTSVRRDIVAPIITGLR